MRNAQEELSSLQTPLSCGYPGELLGLAWVRRPSQSLRIIFLYSEYLKSTSLPCLSWTVDKGAV